MDKNYGQSSALAAGIDFAKGNYIVTMDGDLQNDPMDIPWMLEIIKNVCGQGYLTRFKEKRNMAKNICSR